MHTTNPHIELLRLILEELTSLSHGPTPIVFRTGRPKEAAYTRRVLQCALLALPHIFDVRLSQTQSVMGRAAPAV